MTAAPQRLRGGSQEPSSRCSVACAPTGLGTLDPADSLFRVAGLGPVLPARCATSWRAPAPVDARSGGQRPDLTTPENEAELNYLARVGHALLLFASAHAATGTRAPNWWRATLPANINYDPARPGPLRGQPARQPAPTLLFAHWHAMVKIWTCVQQGEYARLVELDYQFHDFICRAPVTDALPRQWSAISGKVACTSPRPTLHVSQSGNSSCGATVNRGRARSRDRVAGQPVIQEHLGEAERLRRGSERTGRRSRPMGESVSSENPGAQGASAVRGWAAGEPRGASRLLRKAHLR